MNRLTQKAQEYIINAINYTDEQREKINNTHTISFYIGGRQIQQPIDTHKYSTIEGIQQQMDEFDQIHGILYYVNPETMNVDTFCVTLDKDLFYAQPRIIQMMKDMGIDCTHMN